jgi:hypothetical protein
VGCITRQIESDAIASTDFQSRLDRLRRLRNFIIKKNIRDQSESDPPKSKPASITLGKLNSLCFNGKGRQPSDDEWDELSSKLQYLYGLLNEAEKRKFHFELELHKLKWFPVLLVISSFILLIMPGIVSSYYEYAYGDATIWNAKLIALWDFAVFLVWAAVVGALGAIAFIGSFES